MALGVQIGFLAFAVSLVVGVAILLSQRWHGRWTYDETVGVQKLHRHAVPRVGGIAVLAGLAAGLWLAPAELWPFVLAAVPAFAAGLAEDVTKRVGAGPRLVATLVSGAAFCLLTGDAIALPGLPPMPLLTVIAVAGVANAMNIIDGLNGLSAGTALIALMAFGVAAWSVGDGPLLVVSCLVFGAILGFLVLNFPGGRLFLGDGGAYLVGVLLAELAVSLPARNAELSPLLGLLVLAYPVIETLVTIVRRGWHQGGNPGTADRLHLHSLLYRHRMAAASRGAKRAVQPMVLSVLILLALPVAAAALAIGWRRQDGFTLLGMLAMALIYLALYAQLLTNQRTTTGRATGYRPWGRAVRASRASP